MIYIDKMEELHTNIKPYRDYTDQLFALYKVLGMQSIDDFHAEPESRWDEKNFMSFFSDITRSKDKVHEFDESDFKIYDDFVVLSGDIKFCAGMLHYLYPFITKGHDQFSSTIIDRRYSMHVSFGYQSVYQFWDRIGDLLWHFFKTGLKRQTIYTGRVLNNLNPIYKSMQEYKDLEAAFKSFNDFFDVRHGVVHDFSIGTQLYWERQAAFRNYEANVSLQTKLTEYREKLTACLPLCIEALGYALRLISRIESGKE
ncbi:MAG: hypothetical protein EON51_01940 [Acinetobacter sp.]|nr:MAG: hypothetical protein EON51_01940 [Acinetobacter sp.]